LHYLKIFSEKKYFFNLFGPELMNLLIHHQLKRAQRSLKKTRYLQRQPRNCENVTLVARQK